MGDAPQESAKEPATRTKRAQSSGSKARRLANTKAPRSGPGFAEDHQKGGDLITWIPDARWKQFQNHSQLQISRAHGGRVGLGNLGNTCFMNTGLQCLSHIEPLCAYFLTGAYTRDVVDKEDEGALARSFAELQSRLWRPLAGDCRSHRPDEMKEAVARLAPHLFSKQRQQDVYEFLGYLLDGLQEALSRPRVPLARARAGSRDRVATPAASPAASAWAAAGVGLIGGGGPRALAGGDGGPAPLALETASADGMCEAVEATSDGAALAESAARVGDGTRHPSASTAATVPFCRLRPLSFLLRLFEGKLRSQVRCTACGAHSSTLNSFLSLSLPVRKSTLSFEEALADFEVEEVLSGANAWDCPRCKQKVKAKKKLELWRLPPVLVVQMKRFSFSKKTQRFVKTHAEVKTPLTIELSRYVRAKNAPPLIYNVVGVANHIGVYGAGHYTATCLHPITRQYYNFNDEHVEYVKNTSQVITSDAYVLVLQHDAEASDKLRQTKLQQETPQQTFAARADCVAATTIDVSQVVDEASEERRLKTTTLPDTSARSVVDTNRGSSELSVVAHGGELPKDCTVPEALVPATPQTTALLTQPVAISQLRVSL